MHEIYFVRIPNSEIDSLKNNEKFLMLLRLCRYQNQLLFCQQTLLDYAEDSTQIGVRQRHNALFFSFGVLYEAMRIVPDLGKEFRHFPSFQKGFANFFKLPDVVYLRSKVLNRMRNGMVFHVDTDAIKKELHDDYSLPTHEFVAFTPGGTFDSLCYPMADEITLNIFIGTASNPEPTGLDTFYDLVGKVGVVTHHFLHCADDLIQEYVRRKQWHAVEDSTFYQRGAASDTWDSTIDP